MNTQIKIKSMKHFKITSFLTANLDLDADLIEKMALNCNTLEVKKNSYLIEPGQTCKHIFFVESGLLRQYTIDAKGKEHNLNFAPENWLITDRNSLFFNEPTHMFIQALEDTTVFALNDDFFDEIKSQDYKFSSFNTLLLHKHINRLQQRIISLLSWSAEERYLDFIKTYPDLTMRIPQTMISSYLGITPESLSRVRKELAQKHKK